MDWEYPPYYEYRPPHKECWYFITLPKFKAGRIHQMQANKSYYLKAQKDLSNQDQDKRCDGCGQDEQNLSTHNYDMPSPEKLETGKGS